MSESEVTHIRDEDVLRRMWQQTEDFGRKKEIRAHMYKLREERLRDLYSPEPLQGKGCEFSAAHAQGHGQSFADQSFQSMKSKEVRDASSPPKEFSYRGQDLKELSNAGWNVESEDRTTDDGRTHVKLVNANIEGRYDVEGGQGQFSAADRQRRAVTEQHDAHSSLRRDKASSQSAAREHVVRRADDGSRVSSTTTSSSSSSQLRQVSSGTRDIPLDDDYDRRRIRDADRNDRVTTTTNDGYQRNSRTTDSSTLRKNDSSTDRNERVTTIINDDYDQNLRTTDSTSRRNDSSIDRNECSTTTINDDYNRNVRTTDSSTMRKNDSSTAELVSRKVEYPDDNTKVIVETRLLPDGTRVTSTRREFRAPAQSSRSEYRSSQSKSYSSQHTSDHRDSTSNTRHTIENRTDDIVDSQRHVDDYDFKKQLREYTNNDNDDHSTRQHHITKINRNITDDTQTNDEFSQKRCETRVYKKVTDQDVSTTNVNEQRRRTTDVDHSTTSQDNYTQAQRHIDRQNAYDIDDTDRRHTTTTHDHNIQRKIVEKTQRVKDFDERVHHISTSRNQDAEVTHYVQKDREVPAERDISSRNIPVDRLQEVPSNNAPNIDISHVSRNITVSVEKTRDVSPKEAVPVEIYRNVPKEKTVPEDKPRNTPKDKIPNDQVVISRKDLKSEEIVEKRTNSEHYQTTYQNDFQSRKVSTDWSPTHQAWASSLRSDTPSTTRPSTRASSPGSRTYKSSTSSLRSSVSPDKSFRKPSSRGGSPNKVDRFSPTRTVTSEKYSSTHSTQSVTEEKIKKNTSPERKPPSGRSPTRPGYSPDRKPQDGFRQRPSVSPEKRPKNVTNRPFTSPERKPTDKKSPVGTRQSPERRPTHQLSNDYPSDSHVPKSPYRSTSSPEKSPHVNKERSPSKSSPSPDRRYEKPTNAPNDYPRTSSPSRPSSLQRQTSPSPDRKQKPQQTVIEPKQQPDKPREKPESRVKTPSTSPDRKPGYMRPTASSQPDEKTKKPLGPEHDSDRKSPSKQTPNNFDKTSKIKEDHYRFVDEETKVYNQTDKINYDNLVNTSRVDESRPYDKNQTDQPKQINTVPSEDSPDYCNTKPETDKLYDTIDRTVVKSNVTTNKQVDKNVTNTIITKNKQERIQKNHEEKDSPSRETSPSKFGTYDKKKSRKEVDSSVVTSITSDNAKVIEIDSLTRRDKTSPAKMPDISPQTGKKTPRNSVSPMKSPIKDTKHKITTDFIASEKRTDDLDKKLSKERPRKLVTPSSSPTRKPVSTEAEPSTGQSSPTTSVSGFIYFGSPRTERPEVTDLDEIYHEPNIPQKLTKSPEDIKTAEENIKRPEHLDKKRSPSPSKIPCRSPSPEKQIPTTKESLPRKSSLKKPATEFNQTSPVEKPPTSFCVSPTEDKPEVIGHKVVKKDRPCEDTNEPETGEPKFSEKSKPPLQRRETYDDRCKKILGLVDDTTETTKETRKYIRKSDSIQNSPSVSPCDSPVPNENSPFSTTITTKKTTTDTVDFLTRERDELSKTVDTINIDQRKPNTRDTQSPTKQKDLITKSKTVKEKKEADVITETVTTKYPTNRQSPEKAISQNSPRDYETRSGESPDRKRTPSPSKSYRPKETSPERKPSSPIRKSPEKVPEYRKTTTVTSTVDTSLILDDVQRTKKITTSQPTRVLESPTRDTSKLTESLSEQTDQPRTTLPDRQKPKDGSPVRKTLSPERKIKSDFPKHHSEPKDNITDGSHPEVNSETMPSYMKSTTATSSKFVSHTTDNVDISYVTSTQEIKEPKTKSSSPTREAPPAKSPTKPSQPSASYPARTDISPDKKLAPTTQSKQPQPKDDAPGYMKTTRTASTKTTVLNDVQDTAQVTRTTVEKKRVSSGSVSPSRKSTQPKSSSERTPSPSKPVRPTEISINKRPGQSQPSSPVKESPSKKPDTKQPLVSTPTKPNSQVPGCMKTTASTTFKREQDTTEYITELTENCQRNESITSDTKYSRDFDLPSEFTPESKGRSTEYPHNDSPSRPITQHTPKRQESPERKSSHPEHKEKSPTRHELPGYLKTTESMTSKFETASTSENDERSTIKTNVHHNYSTDIKSFENLDGTRSRSQSPLKPTDKSPKALATSPHDRSSPKSPVKEHHTDKERPKHKPSRTSTSPERPGYIKHTASITSKFDSTSIPHDNKESYVLHESEIKRPTFKKPISPNRQSPEREFKNVPEYISKPEEPRNVRTPSPSKKITTVSETNTDFIMSEREQEIMNKVQKSLRKLSPERKEKSPSRERSPTKTTTSLQDLDIVKSETNQIDDFITEDHTEILEDQITITSKVPRPTQLREDKPKDQKPSSKPSSRNVSPTKRTPITPTSNKTPESPTKPRSFSPKKGISHIDRPQSPQQSKISGIKPREQIPHHLTRKPTPATLSTTRIERLTTELKKPNGVSKQNIHIKTSPTKTANRSIPSPTGKVNEPEPKRSPTSKKENVLRTTSDIAMKPKKTASPQRMKSKPEIQVSDMSTKSSKTQRPIIKEPHTKLPTKPKSATSLNTSVDEDDIIIDVQQSKSSRENSPDRICPTPINFADDVGVPRFPDEVSEPDDELVKRTHHTIHETETLVDDIVEICEDEELFVKKYDMDDITEHDDSLLSVNDKVNKFTSKINSVKKPKDSTTIFKDTEKRVHSDFVDENLKTDECLLTVSEKVNKFAKGPRDTKESRSPSRKITDEYDRDTVYTDDYTKLSVNDKAHLFVETAENVKVTKMKPTQKVERPDLSQVDESLKSDDCLLSVSDKVNKFVKTAEQYVTDTQEVEVKDVKIKQQHDKTINQITDDDDEETYRKKETVQIQETHTYSGKPFDLPEEEYKPRETNYKPTKPNTKDYRTAHPKPVDKTPPVKITTLRSSEAVKKAKALFENIATTQKSTKKDTIQTSKTTKLTDIGVVTKSPKTDSTTALHPSVEHVSPQTTDDDIEEEVCYTEHPSFATPTKPQHSHVDEKPRSSPNRISTKSPDVHRARSPMHEKREITTTKSVLSRYPVTTRAESPRHRPESPKQRTESPRQRTESPRQRPDSDKPEKIPGYLRPTKTSQIKEETKVEETEVSSRRGSGKFGVELRRTSVERSTVSSERRRSVEHHQPCIEDIFDLDLLEQMLEKVVGYEQRRRIRAQIRVAKNHSEHVVETNIHTKTSKQTTNVPKSRSPDRKAAKSPERAPKPTPQRTLSPERINRSTPQKIVPERTQPREATINGHIKEVTKTTTSATRQRPQSPEKPAPKSTLAPRTPVRQPSPDKRRTTSPSKVAAKTKGNRFNEYASAYMKKVGLNESDKVKFSDAKMKKTIDSRQTVKHEKQQQTVQEFTTTKSFTERTSSKDVIELVQTNGKRSPSPEKRQSPERKVQFPDSRKQIPDRRAQSPEHKQFSPERKVLSSEVTLQNTDRKAYSPDRKTHSPERLHQRTPSPDFKRPKADSAKQTVIKTVYDVDKKIPSKPVQEEKPSWVTNRNLKKITSESRTFSSKKIENEKPKYRAPSPSKVIAKPIDVITSSYGPGPLDADGKPLFGIKALRNGGSNFQVKGTVVRQEFHSRNGGEPEGTVSVTAYSTQPEELQQLLQGSEPPSRIHGLAAITTTKKFGGDTGNTLSSVHTKEDRASIEQFTHHDRRVEHLERSFDTRTQEFHADTSIEEITDDATLEDITGSRRIENKKEYRQDKTDRTRKGEVTETKRQKVEDRREKMERRDDKKTVRQSSVKSLTEKYIKSANDSGKSDRTSYPKAGLILRTTSMRDSVSSDDHPGLQRTDSEHSVCSVDDTVETTTTEQIGDGLRTTTTRTTHHHHHHPVTTHTRDSTVVTHHEPVTTTKKTVITQEPVITTRKTMVISQEPVITTKRTTVVSQEPVIQRVTQTRQGGTVTTERSFLDSNTKVTGVQDILTRMKNADIVIQEGDSTEDSEARALLNKFLGASVLMAGMQGYVTEQHGDQITLHQQSVRSSSDKSSRTQETSRSFHEIDLDQCWDEALLKKLLEECTDYEQRRRLRARIRTLMAEQEACASAVTEALGASGAGATSGGDESREEEEVTVTSSVRRDSSDKTVSSSTTTRTSKVTEMTRSAPKPVSPFAKFRQLEKQNSTNSPNSPKTPQSPGSPSQPFFKFTDPALQSSALTIKERLLQWCRDKTRDYENVKLENFSTSWADGLAFCALVHHFLPTAFDYSKLTPDRRRHNFTLAFKVADEKAGIYPLLDVDDMVAMRKPDWKCVFTYVQAIYRRFKDEP